MVDIEGLHLQAHERERLRHPLVGGVILFARNFADRAQLQALCADIHGACTPPLLIAADQEGGRVQRFRSDGFTPLPSMAALGRLWDAHPARALGVAADLGLVLASELRACGVDLSFAPVLDLAWGPSQVIGDRALHAGAPAVLALATALIQGFAQAGLAACGKHFPGHGWAAADSHHEMPVDERSLERILADDVLPYRLLGDALLPAVMPAHVVYPEVDALPAGFSPVWIQEVLRTRLEYDGLVFSDDLTMEAASVAGDIHARAQAALQAGCDMVLVCNRPDLADQLLAQLSVSSRPESRARLRRLMPQGTAMSWEVLHDDGRYQHARERLRSKKLSG